MKRIKNVSEKRKFCYITYSKHNLKIKNPKKQFKDAGTGMGGGGQWEQAGLIVLRLGWGDDTPNLSEHFSLNAALFLFVL